MTKRLTSASLFFALFYTELHLRRVGYDVIIESVCWGLSREVARPAHSVLRILKELAPHHNCS